MKQFHKSKLGLGISVATGVLCSGAALAQQEQAGNATLEEVTVTAMKTESTVQETPVALSVMTGAALAESGVNSVSDLQNVVPSVSIGRDIFGVNINIRGVTTTDTTSKGEQGIAFNVDGITIGRPREQGLAFFDVDRVEVLRGPQGTLYGKSTTGGVINVVTQRPTDEFSLESDFELGNYGTLRNTTVINTPVNDRFALRAAVSTNKRDGWLEPEEGEARNDQEDLSYRLSGLYDFSDTSSLFVTASAGHVGGTGVGTVPLGTFLKESGEDQRRIYSNPFGGDVDENFSNITAEFTTDLGEVDLAYVAGYRDYDANTITSDTFDPAGNADFSGNPQYGWAQYRGSARTDSHELRLSAASGALSWVAGVNWYREQLSESDHNWTAPVPSPTLEDSVNGIDPVNATDHESAGVFGQLTYSLTDALALTAGLRYSEDEVVRRGTFAAGPFDAEGNLCTPPDDCIGGPNNGEQSDSKVTYRLGLDYALSDFSMIYASVATGYKAGGFNDFDPSTGGTAPYDPESLIAYELGYKGELADGLQLNSAFYYYDYEEAQISSLVNIEGNFVIYTRLVPTRIMGLENELSWALSDSDRLDLTLTLADSEYREFYAGLFQDVDWSGKTLDKVADVTASIAYSHDWMLSNGSSLTGRIASRYNSGYVVSQFVSAVQMEQDAFTRTDANLTWRSADEKYEVGLFVRNLENEIQIISAPETYNPANLNVAGVPVSEPRMYGVRFGIDF